MDGFLIVSFAPLKNAPWSRRNYQLPNHTIKHSSGKKKEEEKLQCRTQKTIQTGVNYERDDADVFSSFTALK